jgi:hypothetical protein
MTRKERADNYLTPIRNNCKQTASFEYKPDKVGYIFVRMTCVFEDDDGDSEIVFSVPVSYVKEYLDTEDLNEVYEFMENEYTSEDSQAILDKAWIDGEVYDAF